MAGLKPRPFKDHNESFRNLAKNERDIAHPRPWPTSHCESADHKRHQQPTDNERPATRLLAPVGCVMPIATADSVVAFSSLFICSQLTAAAALSG